MSICSTNWPQQSLCHIFHIVCLAYSQMTKNAPKFYTYLVHNSGLAHSQVIPVQLTQLIMAGSLAVQKNYTVMSGKNFRLSFV
jgi:hypothetical protein